MNGSNRMADSFEFDRGELSREENDEYVRLAWKRKDKKGHRWLYLLFFILGISGFMIYTARSLMSARQIKNNNYKSEAKIYPQKTEDEGESLKELDDEILKDLDENILGPETAEEKEPEKQSFLYDFILSKAFADEEKFKTYEGAFKSLNRIEKEAFANYYKAHKKEMVKIYNGAGGKDKKTEAYEAVYKYIFNQVKDLKDENGNNIFRKEILNALPEAIILAQPKKISAAAENPQRIIPKTPKTQGVPLTAKEANEVFNSSFKRWKEFKDTSNTARQSYILFSDEKNKQYLLDILQGIYKYKGKVGLDAARKYIDDYSIKVAFELPAETAREVSEKVEEKTVITHEEKVIKIIPVKSEKVEAQKIIIKKRVVKRPKNTALNYTYIRKGESVDNAARRIKKRLALSKAQFINAWYESRAFIHGKVVSFDDIASVPKKTKLVYSGKKGYFELNLPKKGKILTYSDLYRAYVNHRKPVPVWLKRKLGFNLKQKKEVHIFRAPSVFEHREELPKPTVSSKITVNNPSVLQQETIEQAPSEPKEEDLFYSSPIYKIGKEMNMAELDARSLNSALARFGIITPDDNLKKLILIVSKNPALFKSKKGEWNGEKIEFVSRHLNLSLSDFVKIFEIREILYENLGLQLLYEDIYKRFPEIISGKADLTSSFKNNAKSCYGRI